MALTARRNDRLLIDGELVEAEGGRTFTSIDPATEEGLGEGLRQLAAAMRDDLEDLRALTVHEVGVPISMTSGPALEGPIEIPDYYADMAESYDGTVDLGGRAHPHRHHRRERRHVARARRALRRLQGVRLRPGERPDGPRGVPADEAAGHAGQLDADARPGFSSSSGGPARWC